MFVSPVCTDIPWTFRVLTQWWPSRCCPIGCAMQTALWTLSSTISWAVSTLHHWTLLISLCMNHVGSFCFPWGILFFTLLYSICRRIRCIFLSQICHCAVITAYNNLFNNQKLWFQPKQFTYMRRIILTTPVTFLSDINWLVFVMEAQCV
jgi:hypothetical protein